MTDKELKKLRRADLIEILYYLSKENDDLRQENSQLRDRLDALVGKAIEQSQNYPPEQSEDDHE